MDINKINQIKVFQRHQAIAENLTNGITKLLVDLQTTNQLSCFGMLFFDAFNEIFVANVDSNGQNVIEEYLELFPNQDVAKVLLTDYCRISMGNHYLLMKQNEYEHMDLDVLELIGFHLSNIVEMYLLKQKCEQQKDEANFMLRILDQMEEMIAVKDINHKFLFVNKAADDAFKYSNDTVNGKTVEEIYPPSEVEKIYKLDQDVYDSAHPIKTDIEMLISQGFVHAESDRRVFKDDEQNIIGILTVNRNITQRRIIESQLNNAVLFQNKLLAIAQQFINVSEENVDQAIENALGVSGSFIFADRAYVFDYDLENQIMINTHEWCSKGTEPSIDLLKDVPIADFIDDWYKPHLEGREIYVPNVDKLNHESNLYAILKMQDIKSVFTIPLSYNNQLLGFVGFDANNDFRDWSEEERKLLKILAELIVNLKRSQKKNTELQKAKFIAEEASKAKGVFLANMSHEIRTPLSGIFSAISLLQETKIDSEQIEYIEIAKTSIESLSNIINDILDLTKIEHGNIKFEDSYFNLENELWQIIKTQENIFRQKGLILDFNFDYKINNLVYFDRLRLRQVLLNLLGNAIKFTEKGTVQLTVKLIEENNDSYQLEFSLFDTGIGIDKNIVNNITERFVQGDLAATKNYSGTGLGLSIVKGILKQYNSQIKIESELGFGSKFTFELNLKKGESILKKLKALSNKKMLILTQSGDSSFDDRDFFKQFGLKIYYNFIDDALYSGNMMYDYIVYYQLGKIPDYHIIKEIIEKYGNKDTQFIFCSNYIDVESRKILVDMQIQHQIALPITREKFVETLLSRKSASERDHDFNIDQRPREEQFKDLRVLVVDDNKINRQAIDAILKKRGIQTILASSGIEAIEVVKNTPVNLVLMDIQMPGMDGYTTTKVIRDLNFTMDELPIISMSATGIDSSIESVLKLGINDAIPKPFKVNELIDKIIKHTGSVTQKKEFCAQIPDKLKPFSEDLFINVYDQKPDLGYKIVEGFKDDYSSDITKMEISFAHQDWDSLVSEAHYFKGSASYVAAERIVWICSYIIDLCKKNDISMLKDLIMSLRDEIELWSTSIDIWIAREKNV